MGAMRSLAFLLLAVVCSCSKRGKELSPADPTVPSIPATPPDYPTEDLEGAYLWHSKVLSTINGKDTILDEVISDDIDVSGDSILTIRSEENYAGGNNPFYKLTAVSDSEMIFRQSTKKGITYNFKNRRVVWNTGYSSPRYAVTGQTVKWSPLYQAKLDELRLWERIETYYLTYSGDSDTTIARPDTVGSAFLLFMLVSGFDKSHLSLAGADSTGVIYKKWYYDIGPNTRSVTGTIHYFVANDSLCIYYREPSVFGRSYTFNTK